MNRNLAAQANRATLRAKQAARINQDLAILAAALAMLGKRETQRHWQPCGHDDPSWCTPECTPPWKARQPRR